MHGIYGERHTFYRENNPENRLSAFGSSYHFQLRNIAEYTVVSRKLFRERTDIGTFDWWSIENENAAQV